MDNASTDQTLTYEGHEYRYDGDTGNIHQTIDDDIVARLELDTDTEYLHAYNSDGEHLELTHTRNIDTDENRIKWVLYVALYGH